MGYKQVDTFLCILARIAEALEGIDATLANIEETLNERKGAADGG